MDKIDPEKDMVQAVITAPTRELAQQIFDNARLFEKYNPKLRVSLIIGGNDRQKTIQKLTTQPHVVIGTPGRIKDLSLDEQALKITTADIMVIDEADMTFEFGYLEDIDAVASKMKEDLHFYIHRSGRCGRGKYTGICYSLYDSTDENNLRILERRGIEFKNMGIKNNKFVDLGERLKRTKRVKQQTELEKEVQKIIRRPQKVKPGYKKKRKREIEKLVRKQKRAIIQNDIRRQKKERARAAQIAKRKEEEI